VAIRTAPEDGPKEFADVTSFYPTFLYESLWDALMCLLASPGIARRFCERVKGGAVFLLYICLYSMGRFLVETPR
jgi:phosphatidylglycerol:prolipoprotein diacylglycerol transferase